MRFTLYILIAALLLAAASGYRLYQSHSPLGAKLASIVAPGDSQVVDCTALVKQQPLVLLVLGQSNAGNHGTLVQTGDEPVAMLAGNTCVLANDPLPGATGTGGSIWRHLPAVLSPQFAGRKVLLSIVAVDATTIDDWTLPDSPLAKRLARQLNALQQRGLQADFVLWQQGEADARINTSTEAYLNGLRRLAAALAHEGTRVPVLLARSTVCRSPPNANIRQAVERATSAGIIFAPGPDTDLLLGEGFRRDGCHFNDRGLKEAARAWVTMLQQAMSSTVRP